MFAHLQHIYDPRERFLVGVADILLTALMSPSRLLARRPAVRRPRRILVLRLERIGDLLMTLGALESLRATWPEAEIHLVVGSWNDAVARQLPWVDRVETLDAPWLARDEAHLGLGGVLSRAVTWRRHEYDLAINLEGDIRSNLLIGLSGAPHRVGFPMAGGGPVLSTSVPHDPRRHTDENTRQVVRDAASALGVGAVEPSPRWPRFALPENAVHQAAALLSAGGHVAGRPLVGLHASGGRPIKQWHPSRFGEAAGRLARKLGGPIVLTGTTEDRALVDAAREAIAGDVPVIDLAGPLDLLTLAAVLARLTIYLTGDTGPMHLAAAMGTPVVAVFGISDPARYAPLSPHRRIVRIDLPCSPCNRVRRPPVRCQGHVPDCLEGIGTETVYEAALDLLTEIGRERAGVPNGSSGGDARHDRQGKASEGAP